MRWAEYICLGGVEIANHARTAAYAQNIGLPGLTLPTSCACYALDEGFDTPAGDPAPWYEPTRPESADFLGLYAYGIRPEPVLGRNVFTRDNAGGIISQIRPKERLVPVTGAMFATSAMGMAYGERWLNEALRGTCGGCADDNLDLLPACPEDVTYEAESEFRFLRNAGLVDGPLFAGLEDLPECKVQQVAFTLAAAWPWFYHPETICVDDEPLTEGDTLSCVLTTPEWMGDGTFLIDITADDALGTLGTITITGRVSLDGDCPVGTPGDSVPPAWQYTIPGEVVEPGARFIIDGTRRRVTMIDPTTKQARGALRFLEFEGPFIWPDVGPCTTMCVTVEMAGAVAYDSAAAVTIQSYLRET